MAKKSKAIITFKDFVFFVVYEREGGYGRHTKKQLVKMARYDLNVGHIKGGAPHRTEWYPINSSNQPGFASVKYTAWLTWEGVKRLVSHCGFEEYEPNTMGILSIDGCYPAVSLDTLYQSGYGGCTSEEELKKRFRGNYEKAIYDYQDYYHVNCYVSVMVKNERIEEAVHAVFGKYYGELSDEEKAELKPLIERYNELCGKLEDYIGKLVEDGVRCINVDESQFTIDFGQLSTPFKEAV